MKVVILVGGMGFRLREQTEVRPKPMVEIGGRPILWHIMRLYSYYGLNEFVLCLGFKGYLIKEFFLNYDARMKDCTVRLGSKAEVKFHNGIHDEDWMVTLAETGETSLTGTRLRRIVRYLDGQPFCLTYGDGLGNVDIAGLIRFHRRHGKLGTVTGVRPPGRFGELRVSDSRATAFAEKPQTSEGFINGGFFVFEPEFVERYLANDDDVMLEASPLQALAADGELMVWPHDGYWQPMDTYREWKQLEAEWNSGQAKWKLWD